MYVLDTEGDFNRLYKKKIFLKQIYIFRLMPSLSCNGNCSCDPTAFTPVCGSDGRNYFSPCYAGCQTESRNANKTVSYLGSNSRSMASTSTHSLTAMLDRLMVVASPRHAVQACELTGTGRQTGVFFHLLEPSFPFTNRWTFPVSTSWLPH